MRPLIFAARSWPSPRAKRAIAFCAAAKIFLVYTICCAPHFFCACCGTFASWKIYKALAPDRRGPDVKMETADYSHRLRVDATSEFSSGDTYTYIYIIYVLSVHTHALYILCIPRWEGKISPSYSRRSRARANDGQLYRYTRTNCTDAPHHSRWYSFWWCARAALLIYLCDLKLINCRYFYIVEIYLLIPLKIYIL